MEHRGREVLLSVSVILYIVIHARSNLLCVGKRAHNTTFSIMMEWRNRGPAGRCNEGMASTKAWLVKLNLVNKFYLMTSQELIIYLAVYFLLHVSNNYVHTALLKTSVWMKSADK